MGAAASAARAAAENESDQAEQEVGEMMQVLSNKLESIKLEMENTCGAAAGDAIQTEVAGGRTIMRISEIRVSTNEGVSSQIKNGLSSFFNSAQGAVAGDQQAAKSAAIEGAQNLLSAGIDALFDVQSGQAMEKKSSLFCS